MPNSSHGYNDFDFLHNFPPPTANGLPPVSARSGGLGLESYQVVSKKSDEVVNPAGEGMSRSSSVSAPIEMISTPPSMIEDGDGEPA
jgi:hypothetical protein